MVADSKLNCELQTESRKFSALTNHEMCGDMWGEFSLRSWSMLGAEHTSCQNPIWGFPAFP